jgi:hypothetical protein
MLSPAQVLPFLQDPDPKVRGLAAGYLGEAHDRGPATQDDLWAAIDRHRMPSEPHRPARLGWTGPGERSLFLRQLAAFEPTERSVDRLLDELRTERYAHLREDLLRAADEIPVPAKRRLLADPSVTDELDNDMVLGLREDVWLAGQDFEHLWAALAECAAALGADGAIESPAFRRALRLVRALAAHPERAAERALAILRGPAPASDVASWEETFGILIFERVPMPAFEPRLLDVLGHDGDLYLNERACNALVRSGLPEVVAALEQRIPGGPRELRIYGRGVLSQIKIPASEAACVRLLRRSADEYERTEYASCLYHLCASTAEAIGVIAAMVLTGQYDPEPIALDEALLRLGTMVGWAPDEAAWKARPRPDRLAKKRELLRRMEAASRRPPVKLSPDTSVPYGARPRRTGTSR